MILAIVNFGSGPIGLVLVGLAFVLMNVRNKRFVSILVGIANLLIIHIPWHNWLDLGIAVPKIEMITLTSIWIVWMSIGLILYEKSFTVLGTCGLSKQRKITTCLVHQKTVTSPYLLYNKSLPLSQIV